MFIICYFSKAQTDFSVDKWKEYVESMSEDDEETERIENLYIELSYLADHPFDLNSVDIEQLCRLPFITYSQAEQIINYRKRVGAFVSIYELKAVSGMDYTTIELLYPFVSVKNKSVDKHKITVDNMVKYGDNDLIIRYDRCFQQKKGYGSYPDSLLKRYPNRKYLGEPFYTSLRYSYNYDDRLQFGLVGEKDAGEPFWKKTHKGFDYYSFNFLLKDKGILKTLAIGDYKVSFGQGLVVSNDFSLSRTALVTRAERMNYGFRRHYSTNEYDFFRGAAATVRTRAWNFSFFYSYKKMDGAVENDTFPSFKTDGLHRLKRDWDKRRKIGVNTVGGNVRFVKSHFNIGMTAVGYSFGDAVFFPQDKPYNHFVFRGKSNYNAGVDYMLKNKFGKIYGETAISANGAIATQNAVFISPVSYFNMILLYRYYDKSYQSLYGNAFSQNSTVQNEQGFYYGLQWSPFAYWKISAYADFFSFPWLKYQSDCLQKGKEYMVQMDYVPNNKFSSYLRYKEKKRDGVGVQRRLRIQALYVFFDSFFFRSSADGILYDKEGKTNMGYMLSQSISWKNKKSPIQMDLYGAWFSTDGYDVRISSYEKNILYAFNIPSFYGKGVRIAAVIGGNIHNSIKISAKVGHTLYNDRNIIGSGTEQIEGSNKTDLYLQVRFKF